jgi:hypothetical protein
MRLRCLVCCAALLALATLAGCGSQGFAPSLGKPAQVSVRGVDGVTGDLTFTPIRAMHVAVYYKGQAVPTSGAQTPAQLRQGDCAGPLIAPLTDGNLLPTSAPTPLATLSATAMATAAMPPTAAIATPPVTRPDPAGGMDLALDTSAELYVVVLARRDDPTAPVIACGHPLSGRRQYFDLYPPESGSNGIGRGAALMEPTLATRVEPRLTTTGTAGRVFGWEVREDGCSGSLVAKGTIEENAPEDERTIFAALDTTRWWAAVTANGQQAFCGQIAAG